MNKIRNFVKKNIYFIVSLFVICALFMFIYGKFSRKSIDNKNYSITNNIEFKSDSFDKNKKLTIDGKETKVVKISIKNNYLESKKVGIWYKSDDFDKIKVGNYKNTEDKLMLEGTKIDAGKLLNVTIAITNNDSVPINIEFGMEYTDTYDNLKELTNARYISGTISVNKSGEYRVGDKVTLLDNSDWYVLKESTNLDDYVLLLKSNTIKIVDTKQALSTNGNLVIYTPDDDNILFYLDNTYRKDLENNGLKLGEDAEIRLITLSELQSVGQYEYKNYVYYKKNIPSWLQINKSWWTMTPFSEKSHYYVKKGNVYYTKSDNEKYAVRPVIKILKSNIKQ